MRWTPCANTPRSIERAGAPAFAGRLRTIPVAAAGDDPALPVTWREAWNWARIKNHLGTIEAREELLTLAAAPPRARDRAGTALRERGVEVRLALHQAQRLGEVY
jgi:hypothetical protein